MVRCVQFKHFVEIQSDRNMFVQFSLIVRCIRSLIDGFIYIVGRPNIVFRAYVK